jgi:glyoxylase-like metal-dependent hydrolase (beta-lactamase superfamily II)
LKDDQKFWIGDINIKCFLVPGHTKGHMCYLIDDEYGGYCFLGFINVNSKMNIKALKNRLIDFQVKEIYTAHTGETKYLTDLFAHIEEIPSVLSKGKVGDINAPYDLYEKEE